MNDLLRVQRFWTWHHVLSVFCGAAIGSSAQILLVGMFLWLDPNAITLDPNSTVVSFVSSVGCTGVAMLGWREIWNSVHSCHEILKSGSDSLLGRSKMMYAISFICGGLYSRTVLWYGYTAWIRGNYHQKDKYMATKIMCACLFSCTLTAAIVLFRVIARLRPSRTYGDYSKKQTELLMTPESQC